MSIKAIEYSLGLDRRCYRTGHNYRCFKCQKWVRALDDNEMCFNCMKANGIKRTLDTFSPALLQKETYGKI